MREKLAEQRHNLIIAVTAAIGRLTRARPWSGEALAALGPVCEAARADRAVLLRFAGEGRGVRSERVLVWIRPGTTNVSPAAYSQALSLPLAGDGYDLMHHHEAYVAGHAISLQSGPGLTASDGWLLERVGVRSILRLPVFVDQVLWGVLGFDTLSRNRLWLDPEVLAVWSLARVIGAMIERDGEAGA